MIHRESVRLYSACEPVHLTIILVGSLLFSIVGRRMSLFPMPYGKFGITYLYSVGPLVSGGGISLVASPKERRGGTFLILILIPLASSRIGRAGIIPVAHVLGVAISRSLGRISMVPLLIWYSRRTGPLGEASANLAPICYSRLGYGNLRIPTVARTPFLYSPPLL